MRYFVSLLAVFALAACTPAPPVDQSREMLWNQFGNQPVDALLMSWGAPMSETHLTDGSRMVVYQHSTTYDAQSSYERQSGCKVSFLAQAPHYRISNIAMEGDAGECRMLSQGSTGNVRLSAPPPPPPYIYVPNRRSYPY